jgi:hypothetical protein
MCEGTKGEIRSRTPLSRASEREKQVGATRHESQWSGSLSLPSKRRAASVSRNDLAVHQPAGLAPCRGFAAPAPGLFKAKAGPAWQ